MRRGFAAVAALLALVLGPASLASAATLQVPQTFPTIQSAINAAVDGDTVLVAPGAYVENLDFLGKAITVRSSAGPEVTVIDGAQNGSVVLFQSGEGSESRLEGFSIRNGSGTYLGVLFGGGILCRGSSPTIVGNRILKNTADNGAGISCIEGAAPTLRDNEISKNYALWFGGGVCCEDGSDAYIVKNTLTGNEGGRGGGLACLSSSHPTVIRNKFNQNTSTGGGGIYCGGASYPWIVENEVRANSVHFFGEGGGGIFCDDESAPVIERNRISDHSCDGSGGGIHIQGCSSPAVVENTIRNNTAYVFGGAIYCQNGCDVLVRGNSVEQNNALASYHALYVTESSATIEGNHIFSNGLESDQAQYVFAVSTRGNSAIVIEGNLVDGNRAGIACYEETNVRIERNRTLRNESAGIRLESCTWGLVDSNFAAENSFGGMSAWQCSGLKLSNNMIARNVGYGGLLAGGVTILECDSVRILNNSIVGNFCSGPKGIRCKTATDVIIANNISWNASVPYGYEFKLNECDAAVTHNVVAGGWPGEGNLDSDPRLVDPEGDDFHLRFGSPCVDAGSNGVADLPQWDAEGDPRVVNGDKFPEAVVDIGADELVPEIAARFGTVNAAGASLANVLLVNGSAGQRQRVVTVSVLDPVEASLVAPPAGPTPAAFALYAWAGEPDLSTLTVQPHHLGVTGFPTPLQGSPPQPAVVWNNLGHFGRLGVASHPSSPAPSILFSKTARVPATVSLQGFIQDAGSAADGPVSVTNAVVLKIVE